ncbi:MAG TPA: hypothetical protein VFX42_07515 [Gemmatimonadales bacterium]|nr:hypothetical protein [Gemmatimonadales bacterium]
MSLQLTPEEITSAASRIVTAYCAMDDDAYFASFDPQATLERETIVFTGPAPTASWPFTSTSHSTLSDHGVDQ